MTDKTEIEFVVIEHYEDGLMDATVFTDEETARGEVSYIRRNRPGRKVTLRRREIRDVEVEVWSAEDVHPAAIREVQ